MNQHTTPPHARTRGEGLDGAGCELGGGPDRWGLRVVIHAALDEAGGIGLRGGLPWRLPSDLARLRAATLGRVVVLGRSTCEGMGRLLEDRASVVLSRGGGMGKGGDLSKGGVFVPPAPRKPSTPAAVVVQDWDGAWEAAARAGMGERVCVLGGAVVYAGALAWAREVCAARVPGVWGCDTFCPGLMPDALEAAGFALVEMEGESAPWGGLVRYERWVRGR
jgi:dihydrofolate reductase